MTPRLSTPARAYQAGRIATLRGSTPYRAWQTAEALAGASPEVQAAWAAGVAENPAVPMPGEGELLGLVVREMTQKELS